MKKLLTIILILSMILLAAGLADGDQLVGTWYAYSGIIDDPDLREQAYFEINTFHFTADGKILSSTYDINEEGTTTVKDFNKVGVWSFENGKYYVNFMMTGAKELYFEDGDVFLPVSTYSIRVHKMETVSYVMDFRQ